MLRAVAVLAVAWLPSSAAAVETVRISMGRFDGRVEVVAHGALAVGADREDGPFRDSGRSTLTVEVRGARLTVDGGPWADEAVRFRASATTDAGAPAVDLTLRAGSHQVRGDLVARAHRGRLELINVIPLEEYLVAVLGSEMPVSFPLEAIKAQAVAARTYALQKKLAAYDAPYHLGSSVLHQVYGGVKKEDPRTRQAVAETRGQVLTFDLAPIEAYFHASCGGRTETGLMALGRDLPYLRAVDCPCAKLSTSRWTASVAKSEFEALFGSRTAAVDGRTRTGRARRISLGAGRGVDAVSFRERLGYTRVKGLKFELEDRGDRYELTGRGYGHGAGLCQWGAKVLASQGSSYTQILAHYYPGAELQELY